MKNLIRKTFHISLCLSLIMVFVFSVKKSEAKKNKPVEVYYEMPFNKVIIGAVPSSMSELVPENIPTLKHGTAVLLYRTGNNELRICPAEIKVINLSQPKKLNSSENFISPTGRLEVEADEISGDFSMSDSGKYKIHKDKGVIEKEEQSAGIMKQNTYKTTQTASLPTQSVFKINKTETTQKVSKSQSGFETSAKKITQQGQDKNQSFEIISDKEETYQDISSGESINLNQDTLEISQSQASDKQYLESGETRSDDSETSLLPSVKLKSEALSDTLADSKNKKGREFSEKQGNVLEGYKLLAADLLSLNDETLKDALNDLFNTGAFFDEDWVKALFDMLIKSGLLADSSIKALNEYSHEELLELALKLTGYFDKNMDWINIDIKYSPSQYESDNVKELLRQKRKTADIVKRKFSDEFLASFQENQEKCQLELTFIQLNNDVYHGHKALLKVVLKNNGTEPIYDAVILTAVPDNSKFSDFWDRKPESKGFVNCDINKSEMIAIKLYRPVFQNESFKNMFTIGIDPWVLK